jgi:hypothetical protein
MLEVTVSLVLPVNIVLSPSTTAQKALTVTSNFDVVTKLASFALDLDAVVQELFEICTVKDTIAGRF